MTTTNVRITEAALRARCERLEAALRDVLSDLPGLWGDGVSDGILTLVVEEQHIVAALDALAGEGKS